MDENINIDNHPAVIAAKAKAARETLFNQAARLPPKHSSENAELHRLVRETQALLGRYDLMDNPPVGIAGALATVHDVAIERIDEITSAAEAKGIKRA